MQNSEFSKNGWKSEKVKKGKSQVTNTLAGFFTFPLFLELKRRRFFAFSWRLPFHHRIDTHDLVDPLLRIYVARVVFKGPPVIAECRRVLSRVRQSYPAVEISLGRRLFRCFVRWFGLSGFFGRGYSRIK